MQTAMSAALVKVGLVTEEQVAQAMNTRYHLMPYAGHIMEIERLTTLFIQNGVKTSLSDLAVTVAFQVMLRRREYDEAYAMMLAHLKKVAFEHGIV